MHVVLCRAVLPCVVQTDTELSYYLEHSTDSGSDWSRGASGRSVSCPQMPRNRHAPMPQIAESADEHLVEQQLQQHQQHVHKHNQQQQQHRQQRLEEQVRRAQSQVLQQRQQQGPLNGKLQQDGGQQQPGVQKGPPAQHWDPRQGSKQQKQQQQQDAIAQVAVGRSEPPDPGQEALGGREGSYTPAAAADAWPLNAANGTSEACQPSLTGSISADGVSGVDGSSKEKRWHLVR